MVFLIESVRMFEGIRVFWPPDNNVHYLTVRDQVVWRSKLVWPLTLDLSWLLFVCLLAVKLIWRGLERTVNLPMLANFNRGKNTHINCDGAGKPSHHLETPGMLLVVFLTVLTVNFTTVAKLTVWSKHSENPNPKMPDCALKRTFHTKSVTQQPRQIRGR